MQVIPRLADVVEKEVQEERRLEEIEAARDPKEKVRKKRKARPSPSA